MSLYTTSLMQGLRKAATGKTEGGKVFPAKDYAYVPDPSKPSTWKIRLTEVPGGPPTPAQVGRAIAALGPGGFRGRRAQIPARDMAAVKRRVAAAFRKANPKRPLPATLAKASGEVDDALQSVAALAKDCCGEVRPVRHQGPMILFTDEVDGHQHAVKVSLDPDAYDFHGGYMSSAVAKGAGIHHYHDWRWGPNGDIEITSSAGHTHRVDASAMLSAMVGMR